MAATIDYHLATLGLPTAQFIRDNIYVDNVFLGCNTTDEACQLYAEAKKMFTDANMNLREWVSNSNEVNALLPEQRQYPGTSIKMLGLVWHLPDDTLHIAFSVLDGSLVTKRSVLQQTAAVFDPLGLVAPLTVPAKLFLQHLWQLGISWDEILPPSLEQEWQEVADSLHDIPKLSIPRLVTCANAQLHKLCVLADASSKAYAAAVYLRSVTSSDPVTCNLVFCKSRLAPRSKSTEVSLPRLELLGVLIAVRALVFVRKQLGLQLEEPSIVWTDSVCVLHWLHCSKPLPRFVANRVNEIKAVPNSAFRYVHTSNNPADLPSRGCIASHLTSNQFWWNGPQWLLEDPSSWPEWQFLHVLPMNHPLLYL